MIFRIPLHKRFGNPGYGRVVVEAISELSIGEKEDNLHDVPCKGGELARHFGNAVEVDVDKGYLEEWNAPGLSKVLPQHAGPVRKERNVKLLILLVEDVHFDKTNLKCNVVSDTLIKKCAL